VYGIQAQGRKAGSIAAGENDNISEEAIGRPIINFRYTRNPSSSKYIQTIQVGLGTGQGLETVAALTQCVRNKMFSDARQYEQFEHTQKRSRSALSRFMYTELGLLNRSRRLLASKQVSNDDTSTKRAVAGDANLCHYRGITRNAHAAHHQAAT